MKILINGSEIQAQVLPNNKPTLDETLETFSFVMQSEKSAALYLPMTRVIFEDDDGTRTYFVIVNDNVEILSMNPVIYTHTINCVELSRILSKYLIRNSVFTQPANPQRESYSAACFVLSNRTLVDSVYHGSYDYYKISGGTVATKNYEPLTLSPREKIKNTYIEINMQAVYAQGVQINISFLFQNAKWRTQYKDFFNLQQDSGFQITTVPSSLILAYDDENGDPQTETIGLSDVIPTQYYRFAIGKKLKCARIEELAAQGCNNFYLKFPDTASDFLAGDVTPFENYSFPFIAIQLKIVADVYYYSTKDVLELINKRHKQKYNIDLDLDFPSYFGNVTKKDSLYTIPESSTDLGKLLENTISPNLIFTQVTAYESTAEIFRIFDAIFYLGLNRELGITYFNQLNTKEYESLNLSGFNLAIGEENYVQSLVAYYQDGRVEKEFGYAPIRSSEFGVPEQDDHNFIVDTPIEHIKKVLYKVTSSVVQTNYANPVGNANMEIEIEDGLFELDITPYVLERSIWEIANADKEDTPFRKNPLLKYQLNTVFYTRGDNKICLAYTQKTLINQDVYSFDNALKCSFWRMLGLHGNSMDATNGFTPYGFAHNTWTNQMMKAIFVTTTNGRLKIDSWEDKHKNSESLVDQYSGAIDLNKMGSNMIGLSLKLGEPTMNVSYQINKWADRIKQGEIYKYNNEIWIANVCAITILPNGMLQEKVSFVKNFNELSLRTKLYREKRLSNVSKELTAKSEDNIIDYVYFDTSETDLTYSELGVTPNQIALKYETVIKGLIGTFDRMSSSPIEVPKIDFAMFKSDAMTNYVYVPVIKYGAGNSLCFEFGMNHSISAGNKTTEKTGTWFAPSTTKFFTEAIKYTDDNGFFDKADIYFTSTENNPPDQNYPESLTHGTYYGALKQYEVYKQPNEIFALNYEVAFMPVSLTKDFVYPSFLNNNALIDPLNIFIQKQFHIYYDAADTPEEERKYSQLDRKVLNGSVKRTLSYDSYEIGTGANLGRVTITFTTDAPDCESWAIADEDGNLYFASNRHHTSGQKITLHLYLSQIRRTKIA